MSHIEFAETVIRLPAEQQNEFIEASKKELSEEDWLTTVKFISVYGMFKSPAKYNAMKEAVKATLIEEFYGHPYQKPEKEYFDPCNPVYGMTSINSMGFAY